MGEAASPVCFELAKRLKKPPRALAQEIANSLKRIPGVERGEVAGGGYLNAFFDRAEFFRGTCEEAARGGSTQAKANALKTVVEHTSINPNKAAHIGHLRNAVLGDTYARILRYAGRRVEVQNYIDNTGVQVADVRLGFLHLETLDRLGIGYDLLPRESEVLHLKFWDAAFEMLKQRGAIQFADSGKNA